MTSSTVSLELRIMLPFQCLRPMAKRVDLEFGQRRKPGHMVWSSHQTLRRMEH